MEQLTLTRPDDWHLHLRDGQILSSVAPATAHQFARAVIMPNLQPPITTVTEAMAYQQRIMQTLPADSQFTPLMTLYLTENTTVAEIEAIAASEAVVAVKYYPAGATTNSDAGVSDLHKVWPVIQALSDAKIPLLIHGEVTASSVDIFDRERVFIEQILAPLLENFPDLKVVLEHITTLDAVQFVLQGESRLAATITAHHLLMNRNIMFVGGIKPHYYCLPVLKREQHRQALNEVVASGHPRFFLGTDSAPHAQQRKESACGCAGIYSAPLAMAMYATAFDNMNALDKLEGFASFYGADFYQLPRNQSKMTLIKKDWQVPDTYPLTTGETVIPPFAGQTLAWQVMT